MISFEEAEHIRLEIKVRESLKSTLNDRIKTNNLLIDSLKNQLEEEGYKW